MSIGQDAGHEAAIARPPIPSLSSESPDGVCWWIDHELTVKLSGGRDDKTAILLSRADAVRLARIVLAVDDELVQA